MIPSISRHRHRPTITKKSRLQGTSTTTTRKIIRIIITAVALAYMLTHQLCLLSVLVTPQQQQQQQQQQQYWRIITSAASGMVAHAATWISTTSTKTKRTQLAQQLVQQLPPLPLPFTPNRRQWRRRWCGTGSNQAARCSSFSSSAFALHRFISHPQSPHHRSDSGWFSHQSRRPLVSSSSLFSSFVSSSERTNHSLEASSLNGLPSSTTTTADHNMEDTTKEEDEEETSEQPRVPSKFVPYPFSYRQELEVVIDRLTNRGWGVARVVLPNDEDGDQEEDTPTWNDDGEHQPTTTTTTTTSTTSTDGEPASSPSRLWVVMVPFVIPGERVKVRIFRNHAKYSEADLVEILEPSADHRVTPKCHLFGNCGGCQYQHMSMSSQRNWKRQHVQEAMIQYGLDAFVSLESVRPTLGTDEVYGYRSKLTPHYQAPTTSRRGRKRQSQQQKDNNVNDVESNSNNSIQAIGFQKLTNRQLVDVEHCPIATDAINAKYATLRQELIHPSPSKEEEENESNKKKKALGATLLLRQANPDDTHVTTRHADELTTRVLNRQFTYLAGNFFQNNYYVLPLMVQAVIDAAVAPARMTDEDGPRKTMTHLVDCYCGSGLFAISAAAHFEVVRGIEINDRAVAEATRNAQQNNLTNCHFLSASSEAIFAQIQDFDRSSTVVVLDPPRKGCSDDFIQQLLDFAPQRIVYMACDATTQARDVKDIIGDDHQQNYAMTSVQPFDLFPQTRHIECLVVLEKQANS